MAMFFILGLVLLASWTASTYLYNDENLTREYNVITVCPDDYLQRNGCVTLDHLYNWSNTTYRFVPAFKTLPNQIVRFYAVSNIVLDTAGPDRASISCLGENSGFHFERVKGLTIRNLEFIGCAVRNVSYDSRDCTICIQISRDIQLDNVSFKRGRPNAYSVFATNVNDDISVSNATFRHLQGPAVLIMNENSCQTFYQRDCSENRQVTITDSVFDSATHSTTARFSGESYAIHLVLHGIRDQRANVRISNVSVTNNTHYSETCGIYIESGYRTQGPAAHLRAFTDITLDRIHYENNHALRNTKLSHITRGSEIKFDFFRYVSMSTTVSLSNLSFLNNTVENIGLDYNLLRHHL